jgi:hypothetical protein
MSPKSVARNWRKAQYAEGVLIRLTGGMVHDFQPWPKIDGYLDALTMTANEAAPWLAYCNTLGYYVPEVLQ